MERIDKGGTAVRGRVIATASAVAALVVLGAPAAGAACPNESMRAAQGATALPSCLAYEMISPPKKFGQGALLPNAFSPSDDRANFYSTAGLAGTPGVQKPFGDRYVATRGASEWITSATSPPTEAAIITGGDPIGGPFAYSADFSRWLLLGSDKTHSGVGVFGIYADGLSAPFEPLSPLNIPRDANGLNTAFSVVNLLTQGTASDLSSTVVGTHIASIAYGDEDPQGTGDEEPGLDSNTYVAYRGENGEPRFDLLTRDEAGTGNVYGGRCGSHLGGGVKNISGAPAGRLNQGAISTDGSRIYFTTRPEQPESVGTAGPVCDTANPLRIMTWEETPAGPAVDLLFEGGPAEGNDYFQAASADGSKVFFTTTRSLVASDTDTPAPGASCSGDLGASAACDLYIYDAELPEGERLIQASAGGSGDPDPGKGANVLSSITAVSTDGSHAYFVAQGVLTTDQNPAGKEPQPNQPNLYLYERDEASPSGRTAFLGTLAAGDKGQLWQANQSYVGGAYAVPSIGASEGEGADGHILMLASVASLLEADGDGGLRDIFRYDAAGEALELISPSGGGPSANVSVNSNFRAPHGALGATEGRWASEDGLTVGFTTAEPLVPGDGDEAADPYLWKEGQLVRFDGNALQPIVSPSGNQFGFTTAAALLPQDGDTATDAYLVRVNGGYPPPPPPPDPCNPQAEGSCRGLSTLPPELGPAFQGTGNPKSTKPKCPKGKVRKGSRCVKKQKPKAKKQAGKSRKGGRK